MKLFRRNGKRGDWELARKLSTGDDGRVSITVTPREDTWWRAQGVQQDWVQGDRSKVHAIDNIPPGIPVKLPRGAPKPRINLPDQPDAVGNGANPTITADPERDLEPDDRPDLAPRLPGRPRRPAPAPR